ncbi:hypothetical protein H9639_13925 [Arthrobacter sp. Sa2CUA1]|uniref:DUF1700 domain-containing protein n=2 Tax=Arthrobacter TaxID=1663 RepID=A0ABR8UV29_9MICC|nr:MULTISPECIES: hypothetical protein [Arthrobacter]MBD7996398.1 hypothetical protein [Arthrobacter gallicola]MBD8045352.1 hypothetical protein [Arthrobacter pullicola]
MNADAIKKPLPDSPLVAAYLADLEHALAHSADREEIVASVREHIIDALDAGQHAPEAVRTILHELGPVERIAREASGSAAEPESRTATWGNVAATVAAFLSLILVFILPFVAVPLAFGALVAGLVTFPRGSSRRRAVDWLPILISAASLTITLLGALFFLPAGDPVPAGPALEQSVPAATVQN